MKRYCMLAPVSLPPPELLSLEVFLHVAKKIQKFLQNTRTWGRRGLESHSKAHIKAQTIHGLVSPWEQGSITREEGVVLATLLLASYPPPPRPPKNIFQDGPRLP